MSGEPTTEEILDRHLEAIGASDVDAIVADYSEAAVVCTPDGIMTGLEAIRGLFTAITEVFPPGTELTMKQRHADGEHAYIAWAAETPALEIPIGTDTFVVRDGKIVFQTFAAHINPKG